MGVCLTALGAERAGRCLIRGVCVCVRERERENLELEVPMLCACVPLVVPVCDCVTLCMPAQS